MKTILIVDDLSSNREFLATLFGYAGYQVIEAADGAEALRAARVQRPDLVVSDILMPTMDGLELVNRLRADRATSAVPVVFYTATYRLAEARVLAQFCGAAAVIAKPSDPQAILTVIADVLGDVVAPERLSQAGARKQNAGAQELIAAEQLSSYTRNIVGLRLQLQKAIAQGLSAVGDSRGQDVSDLLIRSLTRIQGLSMRLAALVELSLDVSIQREPRQLIELMCRAAHDVVSARYAAIGVLDAVGRMLYFVTRGMTERQTEQLRADLDVRAGLFRLVTQNGEAQRLCDLAGDAAAADLPACHPPINNFLIVPLRSAQRTYGWLYLADKLGAEEFREEDEQFALTIAGQLAPAYENLLLYQELQESQAFLEKAQEVGAMGSWVSGPRAENKLWWSRETYRIFGVPEDTPIDLDTFYSAVHPDDRGVVQRAVQEAVEKRAVYSISHRIVRPDGSERWIHERAETVVAAGGDDVRLVGILQDITEHKEQQDRIARLTRIYSVLSGINSAIVRLHEREALLKEACRIIVEAGRFPFAWIGMVDRAGDTVRPVAWAGNEQGMLAIFKSRLALTAPAPEQLSLIARAVLERSPMISNDVANDPRIQLKEHLLARNARSVAVLPLLVSGEVIGTVSLRAADIGFFNEEEVRLLNDLAGDISFGLEYIEKTERLDYLAYYDALTGLPNSTLFHDRLAQFLNAAKPGKETIAVVVMDLDRFTQLNDTFGRHVCDALLRVVAEQISGVVPEPYTAARISADTFAVAVAGLRRGVDAAAIVRNRIFEALSRPLRVGEHEIRVSLRAGIALYPGDGSTSAALFKNAEAALKKAQSAGERYLYYAPEINARVAERLSREHKLRQAVEQGQFLLHYQPKLDTASGELTGLEALLRWNDPATGSVLPEDFIDVLEETGLIVDVGRWALQRAMADYRAWRDAGLRPPQIAVNVSPLQLRRQDFVQTVREAIEMHGVGARALEIELTESVIMEDIDTTIDTLQRISAIGATIAVDDFGTGYSSLRYLAQLPVDSLKIDRSFIVTLVDDPDSMTIVSTIVSLAHSLKLNVVAEGVETEQQRSVLKLMGCDEMQGHLFSPARPPEQIGAMLCSFL